MSHMAIFFSFDNNYVMPAAVAFWSLLDRTKADVFWEMWVLHHDISDDGKKLLEGIVARSGKGCLRFLKTGEFLKKEWANGSWEGHQTRNQFISDTLIRCFGARFFPQYDKIIYSDVDVVFADDISDLWAVDVSSVYIAGVRNAFLKFSEKELSHLKEPYYGMLKDSYLAGGIWVMNLKKIRADNLEHRMMEVVQDTSIEKRWNDQDVINIACAGNVAFIPLNYICYPYLREMMLSPRFVSHYTRDELYDSLIHPKIIHYAAYKPWDKRVCYDEMWWTIFDYLGLRWSRCDKDRRTIREASLNEKVGRLRRQRCWLALSLAASLLLSLFLVCGLI